MRCLGCSLLLIALSACAPTSSEMRPPTGALEHTAPGCPLSTAPVLLADLSVADRALWHLPRANTVCALGGAATTPWPAWHGEALDAVR